MKIPPPIPQTSPADYNRWLETIRQTYRQGAEPPPGLTSREACELARRLGLTA